MIRTTSIGHMATRLAVLTLISFPTLVAPVRADFAFDDFADVSDLQLNGNAAQVGNVLRLTSALPGQGGSAFTTTPVAMGDENTFTTFFQFRITDSGGFSDGDGFGADGIVFVIQTVSNSVGGVGGGIGYQGIAPSLGIEFDTWFNFEFSDPNGNHVGMNLNGSVVSSALALEPVRFNDGQVWSVWIEYDGPNDLLDIRWSDNNIRPLAPLMSVFIDVPLILGQNTAFVGFTSGTGAVYSNHDILRWVYYDSLVTIPEPSLSVLLLVGIVCASNACRRQPCHR
jgi:hypothetical protein